MHDCYLSEKEFAARFDVSRRTLQRWRETGQGPRYVRLGKRRIVYRLSDAEAWADSRTYSSRANELTSTIA